jgi:ATP-binding cassette subfamily C (CFTR/MRP) protein 4
LEESSPTNIQPEQDFSPLQTYAKPITKDEGMREGSVSISTYWKYLLFGSSMFRLILTMLLFIVAQLLWTCCDFWVALWADLEESKVKLVGTVVKESISIFGFDLGEHAYLIIYTFLLISVVILSTTKATSFFTYCLRVSRNLHDKMFQALSRADTKFYDENPSGRIMNRFTQDIGSIDEIIPSSFYQVLDFTIQMVGIIGVIIYSNWLLVIPSFLFGLAFYGINIVYLKTSRSIKRLECVWKSPVLTHVAASLQGLTTIRVLGADDLLAKQFNEKQVALL